MFEIFGSLVSLLILVCWFGGAVSLCRLGLYGLLSLAGFVTPPKN